MAKSTLVGYKRFKSKKGNEVCMASVSTPFSPAENGRGCYGDDVQTVFMPENQLDYLQPSDIGKEVKLSYSISSGRAFLVDFVVVGK